MRSDWTGGEPGEERSDTSAKMDTAETAMSNPHLPPEILDHTVDLLHDDQDALKQCCLVSKSWIPRAREHLFAAIRLRAERHLGSWKKTFPDPSTSPARYTKTLIIHCAHVVTAADADAGGWVRDFSRLVRLEMDAEAIMMYSPEPVISLAPFHGFSRTVKSLLVNSAIIPPSQIFNFILSFSLLEDLTVIRHGTSVYDGGSSDGPSTVAHPLNPPAFTGSLNLSLTEGMGHIASKLLSLPGGIHFRSLTLMRHCKEDLPLTMMLVAECSRTLESLDISCGLISTSILYLLPHR